MLNHYGGLYKSLIGDIGIMIYKDRIVNIEVFTKYAKPLHSIETYRNLKENPISKQTIKALTLYLSGKIPLDMQHKSNISLQLFLHGSTFQQDVWNALLRIPHGETRSYKDIAKEIGKPNAMRSVGSACKKNPILFFIPCHRVINSNGNMGGYRAGFDLKKHLLMLETGTKFTI